MKTLITIIISLILTNAYGQDKIIIRDTLSADSLIQVFHRNGQLFFQVPYKNGKQNGWYEQYHENGMIWTKDFRIDGKTIDGYYVELWDNGKIYRKGWYKDGHQIGEWLSYDYEGIPFKIYIYNNKGEWINLKIWNSKKNKWESSGLY